MSEFKAGDLVMCYSSLCKSNCEPYLAKVVLGSSKKTALEDTILVETTKKHGWFFRKGCGFDSDSWDREFYEEGKCYFYIKLGKVKLAPQYQTKLAELL